MKDLQKSYSFLFVVLLLLAGCSAPVYDHHEFELAGVLKEESLALMDKAVDDFSTHKDAVEELKEKLNEAYEYSSARKSNKYSARQWEILKDPDRGLLGGFLKRWESMGSLSEKYITEAKGDIVATFDSILENEANKQK